MELYFVQAGIPSYYWAKTRDSEELLYVCNSKLDFPLTK